MRTLLLLRHATAAPGAGIPDADRPLTAHGREEATAVRAALRDLDLPVARVRCSTARRAQETAEALALGVPVAHEPALYLAPADVLVAEVRTTPDDVPALLVVGHNPGLQALARELVADEAARDRVAARFPPAALAVLALPVQRWADLAAASGALVLLRHPG